MRILRPRWNEHDVASSNRQHLASDAESPLPLDDDEQLFLSEVEMVRARPFPRGNGVDGDAELLGCCSGREPRGQSTYKGSRTSLSSGASLKLRMRRAARSATVLVMGFYVGFNTIDLPRHAKSIDDNAETGRPKRALKRKTDSAALGQLQEYLMRARSVSHTERDKKSPAA